MLRNFLFLLLLSLPACLFSQSLQLPVQAFTADEGLGGATITSLATDNRGFLWVGTPDELLLYDGAQFIPFHYTDSEGNRLSFRRAHMLSLDSLGFLILHEEGAHQYESKTGKLYPSHNPFRYGIAAPVNPFAPTRRQPHLFCFVGNYGSGTYNTQTHRWQKITQHDTYIPIFVISAENQVLWAFQDSSGSATLKDPFTGVVRSHLQLPFPLASAVQLAGGALLLSAEAVPKLWWKATGDAPLLLTAELPPAATLLEVAGQGALVYVAAGNALFQFLPAVKKLREIQSAAGKPMLSKGIIRHLLLRQNTLWVGANAGGLLRISLSGPRFKHLHSPVPAHNFIHAILPDSEGVFTGAFYGAFVRYTKEGRFAEDLTAYLKPPYTQHETYYFNHLERLATGTLFILGGRSAYLFHPATHAVTDLTVSYEEALLQRNLNLKNSPGRRTVRRWGDKQWWTTEIGGLGLWTLTGNGANAKLQLRQYIPLPGSPPEGICSYAGSLWAATAGRLYRINKEGTGVADSFFLPNKTLVTALQGDAQDRLWIATESGLLLWKKGKVIKTFSTENGLPNNHIYTLLQDSAGNLWGSSNRGLFAINTKTFVVRSFTGGEGLQGAEFNSGAMATDQEGRFYFGGMGGTNVFYPAAALQTTTAAAVTITRIAAPDTVYYRYPGAANRLLLQLPHDRAHLQISYTAASPNGGARQRYEYRLNAEEPWTEASREGDLQLTLAPGSYGVEIRLRGFPNSVAKLRVRVIPPFYQQPLFLVVVLAGGAVLIAAAFWTSARARYRRQLIQLEGERRMQGEKERISRELHDELGARAALIAHNAAQLEKTAGKEEKRATAALTARITNTTTDMLIALRETVWTMKQENITPVGLWMRYKNFIAKLGATYNHLHFEIVEGAAISAAHEPLHYAYALNALRILQEATMNAVRHSGATTITVATTGEKERICFLVKDNGKGFSQEEAQAAGRGNGLQNMTDRATESHFYLIINSTAGRGTEVRLCL